MKIKISGPTVLMRLLFICLVVPTVTTQAQNIQTDKIQWNATSLNDLNHNTVVASAPCQFVTTGSQIDWIQGNGSYVNSFTIISTSGTWSDLTKSGSVVSSVKSNSLTGQITVARDNNGITIKLVLSGGTNPIGILYTISTFEKL
jgi:hypothetical protein